MQYGKMERNMPGRIRSQLHYAARVRPHLFVAGVRRLGFMNWLRLRVRKVRNKLCDGHPRLLIVEPTTLCNLRCPRCFRDRMAILPPRQMGLPLYERIVADAAKFCSDIHLYWRGEPFLNPLLFDMIRIASERMFVTVSTNLNTLDGSGIDRILEYPPDFLVVSLDAASADIYNRTRTGGEFTRVTWTIRTLVRERRRKGPFGLPHVCCQMVVSDVNRAEIQKFKRLAMELGADSWHFIEADSYPMLGNCPSDTSLPVDRPCLYVKSMVITAEGSIVLCCNDFGESVRLGHVDEGDLLKLWLDPRHRLVRMAGRRRQLAMCRQCAGGLR